MEFTLLNDRIVYEGELPKEYVLSNVDQTLIVKKGNPWRLISARDGILIDELSSNLDGASIGVFWPNGCQFESPGGKWEMITAPELESILWKLEGVERLVLSAKIPLSKEFKLPFSERRSFQKDFFVRVSSNTVSFSDVFFVSVRKGTLKDVVKKDDRRVQIELKSMEGILELSFEKRESNAFTDVLEQNRRYVGYLKNSVPKKLGDVEKALYVFTLHTALTSFKDFGLAQALTAGVNYSFPPRTYFRDSFWPSLTLLNHRPEYVRNQILVLATGVREDGCPSGVMFLNREEREFLKAYLQQAPEKVRENVKHPNDWWSGHYDSGAFFVLMVSQYIKSTEDLSVLNERVEGGTILEKVKCVLRYLDSLDRNGDGLLDKPLDPKDWADNVLRNGLVTYDAALEVAAFREGAWLLKVSGEPWREVEERFLVKRNNFNEKAWNPLKGYFNDFSGSYVEDHLSLDTVVAILFDVAEKDKAVSTLKAMEEYLETRNNSNQPYRDWGVMNVWPLYKKRSYLFGKSAFPYRYHNGSCWPYLSCAYALARARFGMDPFYPLTSWWKYSLEKGWLNPVEYYSPPYSRGSLHQAWSGYCARVLEEISSKL